MNPDKTHAAPRFVLVVAVDGASDGGHLLDSACALARGIAGAEIHLVRALEPHETEGFPVREAHDRALASARAYLDETARAVQAKAGITVVGHLRVCPAARAIVQTAASTNADLVMVGTHDRKGLSRWAYGSVAERVMRDAACPVLVVRPKHHMASPAPEIDPPCTDCLGVQRESKGAKLWCARHAEHHPVAHLHYEMHEGFGAGAGLIR